MPMEGEALDFDGSRPVLLLMVICDQVITDRETGKKSLIGIFDTFVQPRFPAEIQTTIFARITDAEGDYDIKVELANLDDDVLIGEGGGTISVKDRIELHDLTFKFPFTFKNPGNYEFRLYANRAYLGRIAVKATQIT